MATGFGSAANPISRDPWEYIVDVHWGNPVIVIAEVPTRLCFLASLHPADLDGLLLENKTYAVGDVVPNNDWAVTLTTTADIENGSNLLKNLATERIPTVDRLLFGSVYHINGNGIPAGTTFIYDGDLGGVLSQDATLTAVGATVNIAMNYLFDARCPTGSHIIDYSTVVDSNLAGPVHYRVLADVYSYQVIGSGSTSPPFPPDASTLPGIEDAYSMFFADEFGPYDMQDSIIARFYDPNQPGGPVLYNDQVLQGNVAGFPAGYSGSGPNIAARAWLYQVKFRIDEVVNSIIVNFSRTTDVAIIQKPLSALNFILPGYGGRGVTLRAYEGNAKLVMGGDFHVHALDPATNMALPLLWTELVTLTDPAPAAATQVAHFDSTGLLP